MEFNRKMWSFLLRTEVCQQEATEFTEAAIGIWAAFFMFVFALW